MKKFKFVENSKGSIDLGGEDLEKEKPQSPIKVEELDPEFEALVSSTKQLLNQIKKKDDSLKMHHCMSMY